MTPEEKSLLERTYKLAEENHAMLRSIRRTGRLALAARILYWVVILGFSIGAYYIVQPYINNILSLYGSLSGVNSGVKTGDSSSNSFSNFFK